jgi:hypothetical protein
VPPAIDKMPSYSAAVRVVNLTLRYTGAEVDACIRCAWDPAVQHEASNPTSCSEYIYALGTRQAPSGLRS